MPVPVRMIYHPPKSTNEDRCLKRPYPAMDLHTLPRPIQPRTEPHRHRTSHALIAIAYANEDGTKEEGRIQRS